jgi:ABC-type Fe3+-hydroxamate transport system substrate-binding protein
VRPSRVASLGNYSDRTRKAQPKLTRRRATGVGPLASGAPTGGGGCAATEKVLSLIRRGLNLHAFNQRSVVGILDTIRMLGAIVDAKERAQQLVTALEARLVEARNRAECLPKRPRVFFEEWDDPLISGIGWVSELVEIAGGIDIFADLARQGAAKDRVVTIDEVVAW